jgi:biotin-dependent carboxylase-like uncharacterized protein
VTAALEVVAPGPLATVQDLGRDGWGWLGVSPSGAADPAALRAANRCVGNTDDAAAIEVTLGRLELRTTADVVLGLTGAPCRDLPLGEPVAVRAGEVVRLGPATVGVRSYLAVRGGIDVPPVLGSRSTDLLGGVGPASLRPGDRLPVGTAVASDPSRVQSPPVPGGEVTVTVVPGPRRDWLADDGWRALVTARWSVTARADRTAVVLAGPALHRRDDRELESEGLVTGAVQLPPDGRPVVFLADHPATGGYPVVAVVAETEVRRLAQARPGTVVHFRS